MHPNGEAQPIPLDYTAHPPAPSSWPIGFYVLALVWALLSMRAYTAMTTSYRDEFLAQLRTQIALLVCATLRLAWARHRREQGRGWILYLLLLFASPVLWAILSPHLASLGRLFWGGPLIS